MIFLYLLLLILFIIAVLTRYINPDNLVRFYNSPLRASHITQNGLSSQLYRIEAGACILQDWIFRVGNIEKPQLILHTNLYNDGRFSVIDSRGNEFFLGKAVDNSLDEQDKPIAINPGDQAIFQVSRSIFPYYYGWNIFSSAPLFRYFRYYSLFIQQANGATLQVKWKFTTYKLRDGSWVPDYLGLRGEGLIRINIQLQP